MTYDHWKTTEPDDGAERPEESEEEPKKKQHMELPASRINIALVTLNTEVVRLRASHDALLEAAKEAATVIDCILDDAFSSKLVFPLSRAEANRNQLESAIAKAEELAL
jgi:hypothetical protein